MNANDILSAMTTFELNAFLTVVSYLVCFLISTGVTRRFYIWSVKRTPVLTLGSVVIAWVCCYVMGTVYTWLCAIGIPLMICVKLAMLVSPWLREVQKSVDAVYAQTMA